MKNWIYISFFFFPSVVQSQVYTHPTTGIAGEYVGACETATCSGTYYDNGGAGANYSNNINSIYRIFCPNAVGQCLTATFSSFSIEGGGGCPWELFTVTNGSTQNSPVLWSGCGTGAIGPFTGTANGCLGFRFRSDFTVTMPGWAATFSCAPCAGGPNGSDNNDCVRATQLCAGVAVPGNSTGPGIVSEACGGASCPAGGENYSNWFLVSFATSGTFTFTITPSVGTDDYDYAVYGPNAICSALGASLRCSDSGLTGVTGLSAAAGDNSESVSGDKFTAQMNVTAGQFYYIMIDEWTPTGAGYALSFGGTATISCVPLPVELLNFNATYDESIKSVKLDWETATETNMDHYIVEYSTDLEIFEQIALVKVHENSSQNKQYSVIHSSPDPTETNYYRLKQVDLDGHTRISDIQAVIINDPELQLIAYPNPAEGFTNIEFYSMAENAEYTMEVFDYSAKRLLNYRFNAIKGKNIIPIDLEGFTKGVYFLVMSGNGEVVRTSFVRE